MRLVRLLLVTVVLGSLLAAGWQPAGAVTVPAPIAAYGTIGTRGHGETSAVDGDWMVVGAPYDNEAGTLAGAVHVYKRGLLGWTHEAKLPSWTVDAHGRFGMAVALSGEWLAVGAPLEPHSEGKGWVYLYKRVGDTWEKAQFLKGPGWGGSLAFDGDRLLIGQPDDSTYKTSSGSVQVHRLIGATWYWERAVFPADPAAHQMFGLALDTDDGRIVVAAPARNQAYVFARDGATWTQEAKLQVETRTGNMYGRAIAIDGDTVAMGSVADASTDALGGRHFGGVYIFVRSATGWALQQTLRTTEGDRTFGFGEPVHLSGDTLLVGAPFETVDGQYLAGSAYVFQRAVAVWYQQATLEPDTPTDGARFGASLALTPETVLVGAPGDPRLGPGVGVLLAFPHAA